MKLWELRSYETAVAIEQDWAVYQEQLRACYGRAWRRKAPAQALTPLRLARYGVPLADALARTPALPDAPASGRVPRQPDAPRAGVSRTTADAPKPRASRTVRPRARRASPAGTADAARPDTDEERRRRLRELAAAGQAPASIRQAAEVLGCRQARAKQLLAAEGLLGTTHPEPSPTTEK